MDTGLLKYRMIPNYLLFLFLGVAHYNLMICNIMNRIVLLGSLKGKKNYRKREVWMGTNHIACLFSPFLVLVVQLCTPSISDKLLVNEALPENVQSGFSAITIKSIG